MRALLAAALVVAVAGCGNPRAPRLAAPEAAAEDVQIGRLLTVVRAPSDFRHEHSLVVRVVSQSRRLVPPVDLAEVARAHVDDAIQSRAPATNILHLPPDHSDTRAILDSSCIASRPKPLTQECAVLFRDVAARHGAQAVLIVDDWAARGLLGVLSKTRPGVGLMTVRTQTGALKAVAYTHLGVQVVVIGDNRPALGPPCHEDGSGVYELGAQWDPGTLDPGRLGWLESDLMRRVHASIDRALARSGIVAAYPASCADPANENRTFSPPPALFGG